MELIKRINKDTVAVRTDKGIFNITKQDLKDYSKSRGSMSGYRQLGGIGGDWRMIDIIAGDVGIAFERYYSKPVRKMGIMSMIKSKRRR